MKYFIRITSIIGLSLLSQLAYSAPITDTYVTGDTLTAAKMNNIKSAVNDNDTNVAGKQSLVTGTCGPGSSIRVINADGTVDCEVDNIGTPDFGSILTLSTNTGAAALVVTTEAICPAEAFVTGGGCSAVSSNSTPLTIKVDEPVIIGIGNAPTGWKCTCQANTGETCTPTATAICAQ